MPDRPFSSEEELSEILEKEFGDIETSHLYKNHEGRPKGYGYIEFGDKDTFDLLKVTKEWTVHPESGPIGLRFFIDKNEAKKA